MNLLEPHATILRHALADAARHIDEAQRSDNPAAIRRALAAMWADGHAAYQATLDGERNTLREALAKLETAA